MFYAVLVDFVRGRRWTVCNNVTRYVFCLLEPADGPGSVRGVSRSRMQGKGSPTPCGPIDFKG